jgi:hypothetical protein
MESGESGAPAEVQRSAPLDLRLRGRGDVDALELSLCACRGHNQGGMGIEGIPDLCLLPSSATRNTILTL